MNDVEWWNALAGGGAVFTIDPDYFDALPKPPNVYKVAVDEGKIP
jgi:hypothetical protein